MCFGPDEAELGQRLDRPPPGGAYLQLPDAFGRRFIIFVDTEEEFDWSQPFRRDARSTRAAESLPLIHRRLREHGAEPVYLVDHPIANDLRAVATLRELRERGECEIGTQLHPWVNPPFVEEPTAANSFAGNLSIELERAKLVELTTTIEQGFGCRPTVYRAGRYGVGPNTARLLAELGYRVDVSVRPLFDYRPSGGPDFRHIRPLPYRVGTGGLLEFPLSAAYIGALRKHGAALFDAAGPLPRGRGLLARTGLLSRVPLTPEGVPLRDATRAVDRLIEDGVRLLSISFHSPSAEPGHTPYVRNAADLDRFHRWWSGMFDHLHRRGIAPASLSQAMAAAAAARPLANGDPAPLSPEGARADGPVAQR